MKSRLSVNVLIGINVAVLFFLLISFPGTARGSDGSPSATPESSSPTALPTSSPTNDAIPSPTPTLLISPTVTITETPTITPTFTPSATFTPSITITPSPTIITTTPNIPNDITEPYTISLPIISNLKFVSPPPDLERALFCADLSNPLYIPDNNTNGVNDDLYIADSRVVVDLRVYLDISHTYVGDLVVKLTQLNSGQSVTLMNRPGIYPYYCGFNDIVAILDDAAALPADDKCAYSPHAVSGIYLPTEPLAGFSITSIAGTWRLNVSDHYQNDVGELNHWCLQTTLADRMPVPTPPPTPVNLPSSASISGMWGQNQQLELDCESRSAVDWARHFGFNLDEIDFLNHLPSSDDPEVGFVGNPDGVWGYMPPNDYGVHAPPIASVLRDYGLTAQAARSLRWDDLRAEIASGNPAIVWIVGGNSYNLVNGTPHIYTAGSTGTTSIVAPWEHTVILTGYAPNNVTILNGSQTVTVPLEQFLDSWSALDFMAVLARP